MRFLSRPWFLLIIIVLGAFVVRLYRFDNPIADWHSWRQADTSAVSRNFVTQGYNILRPRFDDLSNVPSGKDNPYGYRFVEFPLYNLLQAATSQYIGIITLEEWGRLITIFSSLGSIVLLYVLVKKYVHETAGLFTAFFYAFLPYNIYYGRTILPDPSVVTTYLAAIYFFSRWTEEESRKWLYFVLSILFAVISLLLKPYAAFFLLPIAVISFEKYRYRVFIQWKLWLFAAIALAPLVGWRLWMQQYPEGIPANTWLLNGNGIRFRPSFFRWIGYERIIKLISGYLGIFLLLPGTLVLLQKRSYVLLSFLVSTVLYVTIFATGNVQHDYYQILIIPSLCILYGVGCTFFLQLGKTFRTNNIVKLVIVSIITLGMFFFSWDQVKDYFNINNRSIIVAGEFIDKNTPQDAKIIALYDGDTSFLYQTKRQGWASLEKDPAEMVQLGADYLVIVNPTEKDLYFSKDFKIMKKTDQYLVYDLHKKS